MRAARTVTLSTSSSRCCPTGSSNTRYSLAKQPSLCIRRSSRLGLLIFYKMSIYYSAVILVPTAAESAALMPTPIALYAAGERVVDAERSPYLPSLPSITGVVCVSQAKRVANKRYALNTHWLKRIRDTIVVHLCAQLEEHNTAEYTTIMRAFKPQFCVSLVLVFCLLCIHRIILVCDCRAGGKRPPVADAARAALLLLGVKRRHDAHRLLVARSAASADR